MTFKKSNLNRRFVKILFSFFFLSLLHHSSFAQAPDWLWAEGDGNSGYGYGSGIAIDNTDTLFISGRIAGSLTLGGLTATGGTIPFIGKYDNAGAGKWLNTHSYSGFDYSYGICRDKNNNIYNTGSNGSGSGVYIERYNNSGTFMWGPVSPNGNCCGYGVAADNLGGVYATGDYNGASITFGSTTLTYGGSAWAGYLAKFDTVDGSVKWATRFNGTGANDGYTVGRGVVTDGEGNVYVCGGYQGTPTFYSANNGPGITAPTAVGFSNFFIAKYDSAGQIQWVNTATSSGIAYNNWYRLNALTIDSCNNLYVTGNFQNTAQFGKISVTSVGGADAFVAKFNGYAQQWEWVQAGGGSGDDFGLALTLDKNSDVYVSGYYSNAPATFGSAVLSSGNTYVAKYANSSGALQWIQSASSAAPSGIVVDSKGYVYVEGTIASAGIVFGSTSLNVGGNGTFLAKLDTAPARTIVPKVNAAYCPGSTVKLPYTANGIFNSGNTFTAQLSNDSGSFVSPVTLGMLNQTASDSITITIPLNTPNGSNYLIRVISSNPAASSYANGCRAYYTNNVYTNDFYVIIGGGGVTAKVSNDTTICAGTPAQLVASGGSTFSWSPGTTLSDSTIANPVATPSVSETYTVTTSNGSCGSSTGKVAVTVAPGATISLSPADTTICSGSTVLLNASGGTIYSWLPANNLSSSTGSNPTASPTVTTTYTVTGSNGACRGSAQVAIQVGNVAVGGNVTAVRDTICEGTPGNLSVTGNSGSTIQWQSSTDDINFTDISGATNSNYRTTPLLATTWYRVAVGGGTCSALSDTFELFVPPALVAYFNETKSADNQLAFNSDSSSGGIRSYHWDFGDGGSSAESNPSHTYIKDTTYYVCLTLYDGSNCSYTFCRYSSVTDAVQTIVAAGQWLVYPNPFSNELTVASEQLNAAVQSIELYDVLGQVVINKSIGNSLNNQFRLDVSGLVKGMYFLEIRTATDNYVQPVIKE